MATERVARLLALTLVGFGVVVLIGAGWIPGIKPDADAYWLAANRLRAGDALYLPPDAYADPIDIYRYAPWFAYAWVPLTHLPQEVAYTLWRLVLALAAVAAVVPILRKPSPAGLTLALLTLGILLSNVPAANVTALMVGALAIAWRSRAGPIVLGVAGSLKIFPLLLVAGYLAERRWRDAAVALGVAAALWSHALLFELSGYPTGFGGVSLFDVAPVAWVVLVLAVVAAIGWLARRGSRWTWLAAAAAIPMAVPRIWLPDTAYVAAVVDAVSRSRRRS